MSDPIADEILDICDSIEETISNVKVQYPQIEVMRLPEDALDEELSENVSLESIAEELRKRNYPCEIEESEDGDVLIVDVSKSNLN